MKDLKDKHIYYAHSMKIYNTRREKKELKFLKKKFASVCNPNTDILWNNIDKMQPYFEAVKKSDTVVASEFLFHIGRGVFDEILKAMQYNIPVLCLKKRRIRFKLVPINKIEVVDQKDWSVRYGKIII